MIKTGDQHLEQLRDGRTVYIGDEKIDDVTCHPAFEKAAKTVAKLYDIKHENKYKNDLSYDEFKSLIITYSQNKKFPDINK